MDPITIAMGLGQFVPGIIKLFGGSDKTAEIADKVLGVAQAVTGTTTPEAAMTTLQADPAKVLEFQNAMADRQTDLEKSYLADTGNARHMQEAALAQDDLFSKRFNYAFAAAWSLFSMIYILLVTFWPPASELGKTIVQIVLGFLLGTAISQIFNFFYGSTRNSEAKNKLLAMMQPPNDIQR